MEAILWQPETLRSISGIDVDGAAAPALPSKGEILERANAQITVVKEQAAAGNPVGIATDLARLRAVKTRHTPDVVARCEDYMVERAAKAKAEEQRDQARAALEQYRTTVFPGYQTAVNLTVRGEELRIKGLQGVLQSPDGPANVSGWSTRGN